MPQTQCRKCGYDGCLPYARAIAGNEVDINRCPPGGEAAITRLAELLGREAKPLDAECGMEQPPQVALVDEAWCIGCVKCIEACPVDAIIGAPKVMHTVIKQYCTGCELCIEPCPMDCIHLIPAAVAGEDLRATADRNRARYLATRSRRRTAKEQRHDLAESIDEETGLKEKREYIQAAVARTRLKRKQQKKPSRSAGE